MCRCSHSDLSSPAYPGYVSTRRKPSSRFCLLYVGGGTFTSAAALNFNSSPPLCPPPPRPPATQELTFFPATGVRVVGGRRGSANNNAVPAASSVDRHAVFSLPSRRPPSASVCFIWESRRITKTHVWPPFFDVSPADALFF